jgi:hypothetical protein
MRRDREETTLHKGAHKQPTLCMAVCKFLHSPVVKAFDHCGAIAVHRSGVEENHSRGICRSDSHRLYGLRFTI